MSCMEYVHELYGELQELCGVLHELYGVCT